MTELYTLRDYQSAAVEAAKASFQTGRSGILVLPTGSGKSLIIAAIANELPGRTIVLQPTKEILEQNKGKLESYGCRHIGVYSACCGRKDIGRVTLATIGSVIRHKDLFEGIDRIIVDECHLVNSKGGMYEEFIRELGARVIGLTATPYRLRSYRHCATGEQMAESRILTRTRPRVFDSFSHITQVQTLFATGYLSPLRYDQDADYDARQIKSNSTAQGYDDEALQDYNRRLSVPRKIADAVRASAARHCLAFTMFRTESAAVLDHLKNARVASAEVSAETPKKERERILCSFRQGRIKCVVNVGVLTVGFDFPSLDCVILGRPTKSVALYYQMTGRGVRPSPGKERCHLIDLCGNVRRFGHIETFELRDRTRRGLWQLQSDLGPLTEVNVETGESVMGRTHVDRVPPRNDGAPIVVSFGKYKDQVIESVPTDYLQWGVGTLDSANWRTLFRKELARRGVGRIASRQFQGVTDDGGCRP